MQRRHLDMLLSAAGIAVVVVLVVLGVYFNDRYNFAHDNVREQLSEQKIFFPEKGDLSEEEAQQPGVVKYAGQRVDDGEKAQVYANELIGLHLKGIGGGKTYAELGGPQFALQDKVDEARKSNDPDLPKLENELADLTRTRDTIFKGETLRGLLLTTYGFWTFGQEARLAMWVTWLAAVVLLLAAFAGIYHALRASREVTV